MFDIGWGELLLIGIVALIAIGPKELPGVLRTIGQMMAKVRRMASDFQGQFNDAMREAELADIKKGIDEIKDVATGVANNDPLKAVENPTSSAAMTPPAASEPVVEPTADTLPKVEVPGAAPEEKKAGA